MHRGCGKKNNVLKLERGPVEAKVKGCQRGGGRDGDGRLGAESNRQIVLSICNTTVGVMKWALAFTVLPKL